MKKARVGLWSVLTFLTTILLIAAIVGNYFANHYATTVNMFLGTSTFKVIKGDSSADTDYFKLDFASEAELAEHEEEVCALIEQEGAVLLKNDNGALPLSSGAKVSLFARAAVDLVYGGTGSGRVDVSTAPNLKTVLEEQGISVNEDLWNWYTSGDIKGKYSRVLAGEISDTLGANTEFKVNEAPWDMVESANSGNFASFGDAAIVVIGRSGGEGADLPAGDNGSGVEWSSGKEGSGNYLELTKEETDMLAGLKALKDNGTFKSIIVILNTANAVELDFLNPDVCGIDYGIDSCLWIGDVGGTGIVGVSRLLSGAVSPSGALADTYWYDNLANPAVVNFYSRPYENMADYGYEKDAGNGIGIQGMYSVYQEGIYLGYRYAETRYEDVVLGQGNAGDFDYAKTVAYPVGYGLSYTDFELSNYALSTNADGDFQIDVDVKNVGDVAGKKIVEVWFQSPYTDYDKQNSIEKSAIELCGYEKTNELAPGDIEHVTVTVPKTELRTYDANGVKTYILDAGDYYFTIANGAHEAINNVLSAKGKTVADGMTADGNAAMTAVWTQDALDTEIFSTSRATGAAITNLFDSADPLKAEVAPDGAENIVWLSRSDWTGTYPTGKFSLSINDALSHDLNVTNYNAADHADTPMPTLGANNGLTLASMIGKEYDDPNWEKLLDQITYDEMVNVITLGFHNTAAVPTIAKPATKDENGPQGLSALLTGGTSAMAYTSEDVRSATFNKSLLEDVGRCIGNDCLQAGYSGLYGPGVNMHRTPYSGRNFEYYSEDPYLAGATAVAETEGIQSKGVYVYLKHVALNDSESSRMGVNTWLNEQAAREIYLEVADRAIIDGGAWCTMSGFNRWGTQWCGEFYALQTDYLRGELGMRGMSITDYSGSSQYMDLIDGMAAGSDIWDSPNPTIHTTLARSDAYRNDPYIVSLMRKAMHNILYTVVNSNAMNGWSDSDTLKLVTPWWQTAFIALIVVTAVLALGSWIMLVKNIKLKKKLKKA